MNSLRLVPLAAAAVLAAAIAYAALNADIRDSFAMIVADPWGLVTLVDLYAGFIVVAVMIALIEPRRPVAVLVIALTPFLGSLVPAIWLAARIGLLVRSGTAR